MNIFWIGCGIVIVIGLLIVFKIRRKWSEVSYQGSIREQCHSVPAAETIFVSIPSYRDEETPKTIYNLFSQAYCPYQVFIGLCYQYVQGQDAEIIPKVIAYANTCNTEPFTPNLEAFLQNNLRIEYVKAELARGPSIARASIEKKLFIDEKYYMMIDSHMRFQQHWDRTLIDYLNKCPSERPIITMYPSTYQRGIRDNSPPSDPHDQQPPSCLYVSHCNDKGFPMFRGRTFVTAPVKPTKQLFWTPCFSFTYSVAHKEVPYDPHSHNLFIGEEITMSVRLWTSGWDFFAPMSMICYHLWDRSYRPTFWELGKSPDDAEKRMQCLLQIRPSNTVHGRLLRSLDKYGLGIQRTLQEYEAFADISFQNNYVGPRALGGITPDAGNEEIISKLGSFEDFHRLGTSIYKK